MERPLSCGREEVMDSIEVGSAKSLAAIRTGKENMLPTCHNRLLPKFSPFNLSVSPPITPNSAIYIYKHTLNTLINII